MTDPIFLISLISYALGLVIGYRWGADSCNPKR